MATAQKRFTSGDRTVTKFDRTPIATGDYDLKLMGRSAEIRKAQGPGKLPYVNVPFEALETAKEEGGKNRWVYQKFWINTEANASGGAPVDNAGQILGLADAIGERESLDAFRIITLKRQPKKGPLEDCDCLNPHDLKKWFVDHDGIVVKGHVIVRRGGKGFNDQNEIDAFIPGDDAGDAQQEVAADEGDEYSAEEVAQEGEEYAEEQAMEADEAQEAEAVDGGEDNEGFTEEEAVEEEPPARKPAPKAAAPKNGANGKQVQRAAAVVAQKQAQARKAQAQKRR